MTWRHHMLTLPLFPAFLLTLMRNMGRLQKLPSRGAKYINASGWIVITPRLVRWYSWWSTTLEKCLTIFQKTCCTPPFWHSRRCNGNISSRHRYFPPLCGTTTISFKEGTSRHPAISILPMHYSERAWHWCLQESGEGDEIHTRKHWDTTDFVNWQVRKYKLVRWCIVCSTQGYENPHWWFHDHGNIRGLCAVHQKEAEHQYFNWGRAFLE